tara:strand:+ start:178 stop:408 length:231 start_codon:yes stop_codon:yes gene_type:complete
MKIAKDAFKSVLPFNLEIQEIRRTQEQIEQRFKKRAMQTEHNKMHRAEKLFEQQQLAERYSDQKNLQGQIINMEVV